METSDALGTATIQAPPRINQIFKYMLELTQSEEMCSLISSMQATWPLLAASDHRIFGFPSAE
jgi:hypothetical protein